MDLETMLIKLIDGLYIINIDNIKKYKILMMIFN